MDIAALLAHPVWGALVRIIIPLAVLLLSIPFVILWERRLLGWMQDRIGPNRVGPHGLLQTIADGIKLFFKEEVIPRGVDRIIYTIAPGIAFLPAVTVFAAIPWGPNPDLTPVANTNIGVLYILAITGLGVYGTVLAGWASNNKYSLLGGLRSSAQLISYELAMGFSLAAVILSSGTLELPRVVAEQAGPLWGVVPWMHNWYILTPWGIVAGALFFVCMIAETNRAPFDLPEAESELVAGFHTEYSSMKFAVFFMGEYAMILTFVALYTVLFFGGWQPLPINLTYMGSFLAGGSFAWLGSVLKFLESSWIAGIWFLLKVFIGFSCFIWVRATLPRLRYDQLMALGWKVLLPMAAVNLWVVAIWLVFGWPAAILATLLVTIGFLWLQTFLAKTPEAPREVKLFDEAVPVQ
ncbi:MAG: NADH-quinone oxidoreductase subunit NuoH [Fimbriimonadia bacterium]|jgi:NADH-quinone oxidoreductase subunit H